MTVVSMTTESVVFEIAVATAAIAASLRGTWPRGALYVLVGLVVNLSVARAYAVTLSHKDIPISYVHSGKSFGIRNSCIRIPQSGKHPLDST